MSILNHTFHHGPKSQNSDSKTLFLCTNDIPKDCKYYHNEKKLRLKMQLKNNETNKRVYIIRITVFKGFCKKEQKKL